VSRHTTGSLTVAACALSWGFVAILVRAVDLPAMAIVFYRVALAAATIALVLALSGRRDLFRLPSRPVLLLGILLALHWSFFFAAIQQTSVASAVLVTYVAPVLVAILARPLLGERLSRVSVGALGVALVGVALVSLASGSGSGGVRAAGVLLATGAAVSMAFLLVLVKRYAANVHPVTVVLYESAVAAIVLSPAAALAGLDLEPTDVGYLLLLGVVLTAAVDIAFIGGLRWVPATTTSILMYLEPVSAALLAALLLGEPIGGQVVVGGIAIVAAGMAVVLSSADPAGVAEAPIGELTRPAQPAAGSPGR